MDFITLLLLAAGLAMDAFAVSICKGLATKHGAGKTAVVCAVWFGGFQALMPMLGYLLGSRFERFFGAAAAWIAFGLLLLIGGNMIREAMFGGEETADGGISAREMFLLAVATSIDALAVGVTISCVPVHVLHAGQFANTVFGVAVIGVVTAAISAMGVLVGGVFGARFQKKAAVAGGAVLILIGVKILLEHFGIL
ncbi:MAG: manganese efflux pump MntP family protein [Oscillospiraceae bacterium]|nr:manganese efflux pump MntP family protein [Oscillospiraceae bacterium]